MSLEGKIAFVSGASMPLGIGRATALTLARRGADVAVSGFNHMEGAISVAEEIKALGRKSIAVKMDVRDYANVQKGFAAIKDELGPVNILVNNAALMGHNISIAKTTIEEWDNEVKICLNSAFYCRTEIFNCLAIIFSRIICMVPYPAMKPRTVDTVGFYTLFLKNCVEGDEVGPPNL